MEPINIMMVGGRRCGKTSILASMVECFEEKMKDTGIDIAVDDFTTLKVLEKKSREAQDYFKLRNKKKPFFTPDDTPSQDWATYTFNISTKGRNSDISVKFTDYPGEFLETQMDRIVKEFAHSRILIVAIDTPHMMEEDQIFDDRRNIERRVTEMIKMAKFADKDRGPGLVLFVPLKCERYRNEGRMDEVAAQIKKSYSPLLNYLMRSDNRITAAITPIYTLGGAAFSQFERGRDGEIILLPNHETPANAIYRFPDPSKTEPEPEFCEQPMLYILSFVLTEAANLKKSRDWWDTIWDGFKDWLNNYATISDYEEHRGTIASRLETHEDGFYVFGK